MPQMRPHHSKKKNLFRRQSSKHRPLPPRKPSRRLAEMRSFDAAGFRQGFEHCALARNLQILGAFGFLSTVKAKPYFADYIPAALRSLHERLAAFGDRCFPKLKQTLQQAMKKMDLAGKR